MATTTSLLSIPSSTLKLKASFKKLHLIRLTLPYKVHPKPFFRLPLRLQCSDSVLQVVESSEQTTEAVSSPSSQSSSSEEDDEENANKRMVYAANIPWSFTKDDIQKLFSECGKVEDVTLLYHHSGKSRGFAFIAMSSPEEARAAIEKFNSYELMGRIMKVEFAKQFDKPPPKRRVKAIQGRTHTVYVSNLAFKARSMHLRNFFSEFNPLYCRVVFEKPLGRSAGYGFVGFETKEAADAAVSQLNEKELMGRPVLLRISKKFENSSEEAQENSSEETQENSSEEAQVSSEES